MPRSAQELLRDILRCHAQAQEILSGVSLDQFASEWRLQLIVERLLEIVGDALRQLEDEAPDVAEQIVDLRKFKGLRNILAHQYAVLEYDILWATVTRALPGLSGRVEVLLKELDEQPG